MRLMKRGDSFDRRTSGDVQFETTMKHSAQAFLMPHRLSEHRSKNLGICESSHWFNDGPLDQCRDMSQQL